MEALHFVRLTSKKSPEQASKEFLYQYYLLIGKSGRKLVPKQYLHFYSVRAQFYIRSQPGNVNWMKIPADISVRFIPKILDEKLLYLNKQDFAEVVKALEWFEIDFEGGELWKPKYLAIQRQYGSID